MTYYAAYDNDGYVVGWYDTDLHPYQVPGQVVVVTPELWAARMDNPSRWQVINGALTPTDTMKPAPTGPTISPA